MIVIDSQQ